MKSINADIFKYLVSLGFIISDKSVHGKNQTRFIHVILKKDNKSYFCKINKSDVVFEAHNNSSIAAYLKNQPPNISFMAPLETFKYKNHLIHLYPYINLPTVSSESTKFRDFNVNLKDLEAYFSSVIRAIDYVSKQELITVSESAVESDFVKKFLRQIEEIQVDVPHGLEYVKYLLKEGKTLYKYSLAINDIQPQNMFWNPNGQELCLFDMEQLGPNYKYYDYARFSSYLWFVCGRPEYAKQFLQLTFSDSDYKTKSEKYRYIRFLLVRLLISDYTNFKGVDERQRIRDLLEWIRTDMIRFVNEL